MFRRFFLSVSLLLLLVIFTGQSASPPSSCPALSEAFVKARLTYWQPRLELQSWRISVVLSPASDLKPNTLGNIHWDGANKTAVIRILDPSGSSVSCPSTIQDMEVTLVHELVHLELSSLPRSQSSRGEEEHAVNRITDALLGLERRGDSAAQITASR